jgi:hypothetical protein
MMKYSKSVDIRHNDLTESIEFPKNSKKKKISNVSSSFLNTESNYSREYDRYNINASQWHSRHKSILSISNFKTRNDHKDRDRLLSYHKSRDFNTKITSLDMSECSSKKFKHSIASVASVPRLSNNLSNDNIIKKRIRYSYDTKQNKLPNFNTTPLKCEEISNQIVDKKNILDNECLEVNENKSSDDFSFNNDDNSSDMDFKYQLKLIKTRTQAVINRLSNANKKLVCRVNSITNLNVN